MTRGPHPCPLFHLMGEGDAIEEFGEVGADEGFDAFFAALGGVGIELAELCLDLVVFEVEPADFVIVAAAFDGGPVGDTGAAGNGVAKVGLFEDFVEAGASAAVGEELVFGEVSTAYAVDDVEETELEGVGHGDLVI